MFLRIILFNPVSERKFESGDHQQKNAGYPTDIPSDPKGILLDYYLQSYPTKQIGDLLSSRYLILSQYSKMTV